MNIKLKNFKKYDLLTIFFFILCYSTFFSFYTILRHNNFHTHSFDLGIFDQIFWNIVHNGTEKNTLEAIPNHLGIHFSLIFYLIAPIYAIFQSPKTLLILQSIALGLSALPLFLIAKEKSHSTLFSLTIAISYLLNPALQNINLFDFHELAFAPLLILSTLYFLEIKENKWFWIFFVLSLIIKEDVALSMMAVGLYIIIVKKERNFGLLVFSISLIYFLATIQILMPYFGHHDYSNRYSNFLPQGRTGYASVFYGALSHPIATLQYVFFSHPKLKYLLILFGYVLFLPLFSKTSLILLIPSLFTNLLSGFLPQYTIGYQYAGIIIPFLFFTSVIGYNNLPALLKKYHKIICYALLLLALMVFTIFKFIPIYHSFSTYKQNYSLIATMQKIPDNASIATLSDIIPHLIHRKEIWMLPKTNSAEYILFDFSKNTNYWPKNKQVIFDLFKELLISKEYGVVDFDGSIILLKKGFDTSKNKETMKEITSHYQTIE